MWGHRGMRPVLYVYAGILLVVVGVAGFLAWPFFSTQSDPGPHQEPSLPKWSASQESRQGPRISNDELFPRPGFVSDATIEELEDEATRVIDELVATYPNSAEALGVSALKYHGFRNVDKAVQIWQQCLEQDPRFADALFGMGQVALQKDEYEQAAQLLRRALRVVPDEPLVSLYLAEALMKLGKAEEAMIVLKDHLDSPHATVEARSMLGQVHFQLEQYEEARKNFEVALQLMPELEVALYGLVRIHALEGNKERAEQYMERFQAVAKREREQHVREIRTRADRNVSLQYVAFLHNAVAEVYQAFGNQQKAETMWRKAAALDPQDLESRMKLLALYGWSSRYREALAVGRELVEREPENVDFWLEVGLLNARLNRREEAVAAVQQAIKLDPNHPRIREANEVFQHLR